MRATSELITRTEDLCSTLEQQPGSESCRGFLDEENWKYHIYEDPNPISSSIKPAMIKSLRTCLLDTETRFILTPREK